MIKGGLKRNGKDYRPGGGRGRRKLSTMIARQLVNGMIKPFTQLGPGQGPSTPGVVQSHRAQGGGGQHKQAGAGAGGLGFDEITKSKDKKKKREDNTP